MFAKDHLFFMQKALQEAQKAYTKNEIPVGAVVVYNEKIISKAYNQVESLQDTTAHAEMIALTSAMTYLNNKYLMDCTLYVTLMPCMMCLGAIICAKVKHVVIGASHTHDTWLWEDMLKKKIISSQDILKEPCSTLLKDFFNEKRKHRMDNKMK